MSLNVQIRMATPNDANAISEFVAFVAERHISPTLAHGGIDVLLASMDVTATRARLDSGFRYTLAEVEGQLVGVATIRFPSHLYYLFVKTEYQRTGIGRQLFEHAHDYVYQTTGSRAMTVNASLNATDAYRRLGFTVVGGVETIEGVRFQPMRWESAT